MNILAHAPQAFTISNLRDQIESDVTGLNVFDCATASA